MTEQNITADTDELDDTEIGDEVTGAGFGEEGINLRSAQLGPVVLGKGAGI